MGEEVNEIQRVIAKGLLPSHDSSDIKDAIKEVSDFLEDYRKAERGEGSLFDDDDWESEYEESPYPEADHLSGPMEALMDAVIEYATQAEDATQPNPALAA